MTGLGLSEIIASRFFYTKATKSYFFTNYLVVTRKIVTFVACFINNSLRKVFRDRDELSTGSECDAQVQKVLDNTNNLIVIRWGY